MIIETPSRLHITLIDMNGIYGRIDGGVGITIEEPKLVLKAETVDENIEIGFKEAQNLTNELMVDYKSKIENSARKMLEFLKIESGLKFEVGETYPPHSGLGSGTQLSLAVGKIILKLNDQDMPARKISKIVGRGGTSGIGTGSFDYGGFIIDGGHKTAEKPSFLPSSASKASPPPIIARYDFPQNWDIILVIPDIPAGASGKKEVNIFQEYCPIPVAEVQKLSHVILMKMMPAVVEGDIDSFGFVVNSIQDIGFKKIELELQHPVIKKIIENLRTAGAAGVGMSSFGPTIYAITDTNTRDISRVAYNTIKNIGGKIIITKAKNNGALIKS